METFTKFIGVLLLGIGITADFFSRGEKREKLVLKDGLITIGKVIPMENFPNCDSLGLQNENALHIDTPSNARMLSASQGSLAALEDYNIYGETALHIAASEGRAETVRFLLGRGLPVDIRTKDANASIRYRDTLQTPLHYAAAVGDTEILKVLVEHGANTSAVTESGDTALHKAALHGKTAAVRWLLERGADANVKNVFGATPLAMAMVNHGQEAAAALLQGAAKESKEELRLEQVDHWLGELQSSPVVLFLECSALLICRLLFN